MSKKTIYLPFVAVKESLLSVRKISFWKSLLLDLAFAIGLIMLFGTYVYSLNLASADTIGELALVLLLKESGVDSYQDAFYEIVPDVSSALWKAALLSVLFFLLVIALISLLYSLSWSVAKSEEYNWQYFKQSYIINLLWLASWLVLFAVTLLSTWLLMFLLVLVLFVVLDFVLRTLFSAKLGFAKIIKGLYSFITTKPHYLLLFLVINSFLLLITLIIGGLASRISVDFSAGLIWLLLFIIVGISRILMIKLISIK